MLISATCPSNDLTTESAMEIEKAWVSRRVKSRRMSETSAGSPVSLTPPTASDRFSRSARSAAMRSDALSDMV
ncbi:hypothetical protein D3C72_2202640 [compost metagenome]